MQLSGAFAVPSVHDLETGSQVSMSTCHKISQLGHCQCPWPERFAPHGLQKQVGSHAGSPAKLAGMLRNEF
jgi:hypothetical protein